MLMVQAWTAKNMYWRKQYPYCYQNNLINFQKSNFAFSRRIAMKCLSWISLFCMQFAGWIISHQNSAKMKKASIWWCPITDYSNNIQVCLIRCNVATPWGKKGILLPSRAVVQNVKFMKRLIFKKYDTIMTSQMKTHLIYYFIRFASTGRKRNNSACKKANNFFKFLIYLY